MVDNRVRTTDSYDRVIQKYTGQETIKITKGVCGSRHKHTAGFVYSPKLKARKQYWVGLKAFDQVKNGLTMTDYLQTNAWKHKMHIEVRVHDDNNEQEVIQEYLLNGGEGFKYVFFNIDRIGHYTVIVKNIETGGCEGGECTEGTSTTTTFYQAEGDLMQVLTTWGDYTKSETLTTELIAGEPPKDAYIESQKVDGQELVLGIKRNI